MLNQSTLTAVSEFLDSAGWNYSVFLRAYATPCANDTSSEQLIRSALGTHAVVTDIDQVTTEGVLSEVRSALSYSGDCLLYTSRCV